MLSNWVKATTTTTGTGTLTLSSVSGRPLPSAIFSVGQYVQYSINTSDGKFESGIGKIAASDTLERSKIFSTYNGTTFDTTAASALSLASGTHTVLITLIGEMAFEPLKSPFTNVTSASVHSTTIVTTESNVAVAAAAKRNTVYPFRLETTGIITGFSIYVSTGVSSSTVLAGLYAARPSDGGPGDLIIKASSTFDTSSTGYKTASVSANKRVNAGWYWGALCVTSATSVPQVTGGSTVRSAMGGSTKTSVGNIREDADATDLADPFPTTTLVVTTGTNQPLIGLIMS